MAFAAPVQEIAAALRDAGLDRLVADGLYPDLTDDLVQAVLAEAGRFASEVIAPLNQPGDAVGAQLSGGAVTAPPGFRQAYAQWARDGWAGVTAPVEQGGQGLPVMLGTALQEMWNAASMAFGLCPLLTAGAIEALRAHAGADLKQVYLDKLVSGQWSGTMNLTEPQAGSDLNAVATRAERQADGTYRLRGAKIFITYGEHDLTENIVHLVLARLPDAPAGTRGLSLFLVPKVLVNADGTPGPRNDLRCARLEHKLGIHASPTCAMLFGEGEGATGFLVGEENRGLAAMFTMMNHARLAVATQGVGIAERAYQQALAYARERRQGRASTADGDGMSPIIAHPDVRRMLLTMKAMTGAARGLCYSLAEAIDRASREPDEGKRRAAQERADLLTPVAKAFATDIGVEVASLGLQVHGGMGYVEETGAAQHLRDARIAPIYEGTNGIQAIDLVTRKLGRSDGAAMRDLIAGLREVAEAARASNRAELGRTGRRLAEATDALDEATQWLVSTLPQNPQAALAGATPYLRLFGLAAGAASLASAALKTEDAEPALIARHFAEAHLPEARTLALVVTEGAGANLAAEKMFT